MRLKHFLKANFFAAFLALLALSCSKKEVTESLIAPENEKSSMLNTNGANAKVSSSFNVMFAITDGKQVLANPSLIFANASVLGDEVFTWVHIENGPSKTAYQPQDWVHINTGEDATKYEPPKDTSNFEHLTEGPDKTSFAPKGSKHIAEGANKTAYTFDGYIHITTGPNKTYFKKDLGELEGDPKGDALRVKPGNL
jgi:hypothetical protein